MPKEQDIVILNIEDGQAEVAKLNWLEGVK
jgi:hypothetical protein